MKEISTETLFKQLNNVHQIIIDARSGKQKSVTF